MTSQAIRGRVAPVALFLAIAFVVVGFLRADGEMTRVERDRTEASASGAATLVEVFLLRELTQLHTFAGVSYEYASDSALLGLNVRPESVDHPNWAVPFEGLWIIDSAGQAHVVAVGTRKSPLLDTTDISSLARSHTSYGPFVLVVRSDHRHTLVFGDPQEQPVHRTIIATVSADSLASMLGRQQGRLLAPLVVTVSGDTIARVGALPNDKARVLRRRIAVPFATDWNVSVGYASSGRGARIALWVVGLGAIVGLGIGLILERRETSRIADRSSELEHLSAELLRANRAKSEFLANVSHELRTPLNAIVGFVDLLRDGVYGPLNSRQAGPVERIEASANHLRHLVDQVLDLAKMAAGRLEVHAEPVELRPFVFDVASEVEPLMTEKGLSLSLAVGASLPRVRTDPTHLRQILINLLGNAVKFTPHGGIAIRGKLIRRAEPPGGGSNREGSTDLLGASPKNDIPWIALQVVDSGIGISDRDRDRIFDEFEQVNAGPRGDSMRRGTGLGLSISRRLARLLGGEITVESELGRGSVFTLWLPVDPGDVRDDRAA